MPLKPLQNKAEIQLYKVLKLDNIVFKNIRKFVNCNTFYITFCKGLRSEPHCCYHMEISHLKQTSEFPVY